MAMVTAATATTATEEKPTDAGKPSYVSYNGSSAADGGGARAPRGGVVDSVVARWRREDMLDRSPLALHAAAAAFAFVALVLVATNQRGDWMQFDRYQEYRCGDGCSSPACPSIRGYPGLIVASISLGTCSRSRRWRSSTRWRRR